MTTNNSDYERKFTDLYELLPEVYHSPLNQALYMNTFNRFLSKRETTHMVDQLASNYNR